MLGVPVYFFSKLSLSLFELGVLFVDHIQNPFAADYLAVYASFLN